FLGVHVTRRIDGGLMIGPNAFLSLSREGYSGLGFNLPDAMSVAGNLGFWRFAAANMATAARELPGVVSIDRLVDTAAHSVPTLVGAGGRRVKLGICSPAIYRYMTLVADIDIA